MKTKEASQCQAVYNGIEDFIVHHSLVAKQPIAIKNSRSAERVYSLQTIRRRRSVTRRALVPTDLRVNNNIGSAKTPQELEGQNAR